MSGSLSWFQYTSDNGQNYAIFADKSNVAAVNTATGGAAPATLPNISLPRSIRPRYALYRSDDGLTNRKVPILTPADLAALTPNSQFTAQGTTVTVKLSSIRGEKIRLPRLTDTGLTT